MHVLIDLFGCPMPVDGKVVETLQAGWPGLKVTLSETGGLAWLDLFWLKAGPGRFDEKALVAAAVEALQPAEGASYQLIERGYSVTSPRETTPWMRTGLPGEETEPGVPEPATPQVTDA